MSIFDSCKLESSFDEMFDKDCNVKEQWKEIFDNLEKNRYKTTRTKTNRN